MLVKGSNPAEGNNKTYSLQINVHVMTQVIEKLLQIISAAAIPVFFSLQPMTLASMNSLAGPIEISSWSPWHLFCDYKIRRQEARVLHIQGHRNQIFLVKHMGVFFSRG